MRLGILRNPASSGNRLRKPPPLPAGATLVETRVANDCRAALATLREAGAEAIVVDGGDGTVRGVVTDLDRVFGAEPPPLAILASGNTNLVGRRLGSIAGAAGIERLAMMTGEEAAARSRPWPVLSIGFADGRRRERGFILGWAAYTQATRIALEEIAARRNAQVLGAIVAVVRRTLARTKGDALRRGLACEFRAEGHAELAGPRFLGMATTLPGPLMWPLDPFWGDGAGAVRWLDILAPPRRLALAAPLVAVGRPMRWLERSGYRSGRTGRIDLSLDGDIVIDGDPLPCGRATITAEGTVRLIRC